MKRGLTPEEYESVRASLIGMEKNLRTIANRLEPAFGKVWGAKARTLLRHVAGFEQELGHKYLEQEDT